MAMRFDLCDLPESTVSLRAEVRAFLAAELDGGPAGAPALRARSWNGIDLDFSQKLGARGWIAMTWPKEFGGHERSALERVVVLEELLAAGAPVSAHWIADPGFREAVGDFLERERAGVAVERNFLEERLPFRKS